MNRSKHIRTANPGLHGLNVHCARQGHRCRRAFSLLELFVVIAVALILTSLLLPALTSVRENVNRVVCASNLRQIAIGQLLFADDHHGRFPDSIMLDHNNGVWKPHELMMSRHTQEDSGWDGLGRLFDLAYCRDAACFYCPSHFGEHSYERYKAEWYEEANNNPIYTNYHHAGAYNWETKRPRFLSRRRPSEMLLAADGLRTISDINHVHGLNAAYGDGAVRWRSDTAHIHPLLPEDGEQPDDPDEYNSIWNVLERPNTTPAPWGH